MRHLSEILCVCIMLLWADRLAAEPAGFACVPDENPYEIMIQGTVTDIATKVPIAGVSIVSEGLRIAMTDEDGRYSVSVPHDAVLFFYATGYNGYKTQVDNRQVIDVQMSELIISLGEAIIVGQMSRKTIVVDQTELEVVGNYLHLKTKFRVPKHVFKSNTRFIVQPKLVNVTCSDESWFRPVIMDGDVYSIENDRITTFEDVPEEKALAPYIVENDLDQSRYVYSYHDSLFVSSERVDNDYRTDCYLSVNGIYENPKKDYLDTVTIAKGTVNPLRFYRYDIPPMELMDSALIPKPKMELISDKGVSKVSFLVGKAVIDESDPGSEAELEAVRTKIDDVLSDRFSTLKGVSVAGYASPEGTYYKNLDLAQRRTALVLDKVTESVPESIKANISLKHSSVVLPWSEVAALMEADSLPSASAVRDIVSRYNDDYVKSQAAIKQMKEYRSIIVPDYLPRLRRVEYEIEFTVFRNLTDSEIRQKYDSGIRSLTRHEWWRLIETAGDEESRIGLERQALKHYPDFTLVANREAVRRINQGIADMSVLEPCMGRDVPYEVMFNHSIACLAGGDVVTADSLVNLLPGSDRVERLKAVVDVKSGRYEEAYPMIASLGGLNEVLVLMCMGRNKEAYEAVVRLLESPENKEDAHVWYIMAACANRMDDLTVSMDALQCAVNLNPDLKELARLDSDVMDILEILYPEE